MVLDNQRAQVDLADFQEGQHYQQDQENLMVRKSQVVLDFLAALVYLATQLGHYCQVVQVDLCLQGHQGFHCHLADLKVQDFLDFQVDLANLVNQESPMAQIVPKNPVDHFVHFVLLVQVVLVAQKVQKVQNHL